MEKKKGQIFGLGLLFVWKSYRKHVVEKKKCVTPSVENAPGIYCKPEIIHPVKVGEGPLIGRGHRAESQQQKWRWAPMWMWEPKGHKTESQEEKWGGMIQSKGESVAARSLDQKKSQRQGWRKPPVVLGWSRVG